ncbi:GTP-sensing pleiotropic transcriptional regulator CodY [Marinilactibacillus kalidii]|uniref:GTP-sensing pleiotropic transcriptional regulator CodY n=1 Tax=Marinilactibacillus kalidii TaxID=2820274 RepID=UPI001ABDBDD8|nr:GTP-sensing pleiotropic transcriptional regulator CodY [Marinilactibacillus kalidii]
MSNEAFLKKVKELNKQANVKEWAKYILSNDSAEIDFPLKSISYALGKLLDANIFIVNAEGNLLGYHERYRVNTQRVRNLIKNKTFPYNYIQRLSGVEETIMNVQIDDNLTIFPVEKRANYPDALTSVVPIVLSDDRLGTLLVGRIQESISDVDGMLIEHAASMIGLEIALEYGKTEVEIEKQLSGAKLAISTLSVTEVKALKGVFTQINQDSQETILTTSEIADKIGVTRSIVVNALRKLVSASVIEQRSMGMKGTYIKVLNPIFAKTLFSNQES